MSDTFRLCETEVVPAYCWRAVQVGFDGAGEGLIYMMFLYSFRYSLGLRPVMDLN